ncbi:MAG: two-component regulator propeller domain-containing protein [Brumimicrobium sp.]
MIKKIKHILPILLLGACVGNQKNETVPPALFPQAQTFGADFEDGYVINSITGDSIQPIVLENGDTLKTGVPISVEPKIISRDSVSSPETIRVNHSSLMTADAHPNRHKILEKLSVIPIDEAKLKSIKLGEGNQDFVLKNKTGDTIPTGISIPAKGKVVKTIQPQPLKAHSPDFKDATTTNISYLDVDQGMNSSYVYSILEDKNGNLWFGTWGGGVTMYNGESFRHFTEKEGLSNSVVLSMLEDNKGNLWFGTNGGGVSMYDGKTFKHFTEKEGLSNNIVLSILEDKNGYLWFGTKGGGVSRYKPKKDVEEGIFKHFTEKEGLSNNVVYSINEDRNGNLWFGTLGGGVCKYGYSEENKVETFSHYTENDGLSNNYVLSIIEDKKGNLWFGTMGGGVSMLTPSKNGEAETFMHFTEKDGLSNNIVLSVVEDEEGDLWFGTNGGGVSMYSPSNTIGEGTFRQFSEKQGLPNNFIYSIIKDKSGNLWFGHVGGGVSKYNSNTFKHFTEKEGLSNNKVHSIIEDKNSNIWFGTRSGGVSMYNGETFKHFTEKDGMPDNEVFSIIEDKNDRLWFGSNDGVTLYNGETFKHFTIAEGLSGNNIHSILEDRKGNIWFGTRHSGITMYNGEVFMHFTEKEGLSNNNIHSIIEDKSGNLWFGTNGGGACRYTPPKAGQKSSFQYFTEKEGLLNNNVHSILEDKNGNLWFGTEAGLCMYVTPSEDQEGLFRHFTETEGLSNNLVWSIIEDKSVKDDAIVVYVTTEKGLTKIAVEDMTRLQQKEKNDHKPIFKIQSFYKQDGLKAIDFFENSAYVDSKNRAWFGSGKVLEMLDLNKFETSKKTPQPLLKNIDVNEQFIDYRNISDSLDNEIEFNGVKRFENYPLSLELPYDKNHLTFHFAAIDWKAPHKIRYSYFMEGLNTTWSKPSQEPKAEYHNLPYGSYTFKTRATGQSGEWSEPFEYRFTINPPWWHTWWARIGYGVLAVLMILGVVRWRTANLKHLQKELEDEVNLATQEIRGQKKEVEKQKELIEDAHKEITDSINYAKRIQSAILPPTKQVKQYLPNCFILYKPKAIVAGDFYWMEYQDNKILFAVADCTGHGVPGAMVSVICNNGLNRSVREFGLTDPGEILNRTREIVIAEFEKSEDDVKDGMDISLCVLDKNSLSWAGANSPLWIIRNGEVLETKADKQPIGKYENPKPFTKHSIPLQKGDIIYIFTDGYQDQFGGEKDKKLKPAYFKKLLLSISNESMDKQGELINEAFENWKGNTEQVDDVCVMGVRIQ